MNEISESAAQPASPGGHPQSRRVLLFGAGATCAALLAGCTTHNANNGAAGQASAPASSAPAADAASGTGGPAVPANFLATTAEVPEGGGKIIEDKHIVITQPQANSFKAFTAVCTHQGCLVSTVANGTIDCPCHGSRFSIRDGAVVNGPATQPLPAIAIKVEGTSIVQS